MKVAVNGRKKKLGELLVERGLISEDVLKVALKVQESTGERLGELLHRWGFVRKKEIAAVMLSHGYEVGDVIEDLEPLTESLPKEVVLEYRIIPIYETNEVVYLVVLDERVKEASEVVKKIKNKEVELVETEYEKAERLYSQFKSALFFSEELKETNSPEALLNAIVSRAVKLGASDVHVDRLEKVSAIKFRVNTVMQVEGTINNELCQRLISVIKDEARMDVALRNKPQDGSFTRKVYGRYVDFRVATIPTVFGEKVTIRVLDREKNTFHLNELKITPIDKWREITTNPFGLVVISGPTGSGKTTTLLTTVRECINVAKKSVYTIEDPVEYKMPLIRQIEIKRPLSFPDVLKSIVRHDPDVVVVGEVRDPTTASLAVDLADTGHLVFATLHTGTVRGALERLKKLSGENFFYLSSVLKGVLVQRLVKGVNGKPLLIVELAWFRNEKEVEDFLNGNEEPYLFPYEKDVAVKVKKGLTTLELVKEVFGPFLDYDEVNRYLKENEIERHL